MAAKCHISLWLRVCVCLRAHTHSLVVVCNCVFLSPVCLCKKMKMPIFFLFHYPPPNTHTHHFSNPSFFFLQKTFRLVSICSQSAKTALIYQPLLFTVTFNERKRQWWSNEEDKAAPPRWREKMKRARRDGMTCVCFCMSFNTFSVADI